MLNSKFSEYLVGTHGANFSCIRINDKCKLRWVMPLRIEEVRAPVELLSCLGIHCAILPTKVGVPHTVTAEVSIEEPLDQWVLKGVDLLFATEDIPQRRIDELQALLKQDTSDALRQIPVGNESNPQ